MRKEMKVLTLLSGGIDSATVLWMMREHERMAIGFLYGQRSAYYESTAAFSLAEMEKVPFETKSLPEMKLPANMVWGGRNAILISHAAAHALANDCDAVAIGCNQTDWEVFPDCRPAFIKGMGAALKEGYGLTLFAPLLHLSKAQVVQEAKTLGVPLEKTWSCYTPIDDLPCGKCMACEVRTRAGA
jgi:7-cyano-7-deazaguanine synthase